jgi:hypothetical protein
MSRLELYRYGKSGAAVATGAAIVASAAMAFAGCEGNATAYGIFPCGFEGYPDCGGSESADAREDGRSDTGFTLHADARTDAHEASVDADRDVMEDAPTDAGDDG